MSFAPPIPWRNIPNSIAGDTPSGCHQARRCVRRLVSHTGLSPPPPQGKNISKGMPRRSVRVCLSFIGSAALHSDREQRYRSSATGSIALRARCSSERITEFAASAKLPSVSGWAPFAKNGLLLTYGPNIRDLYRSLARYVDRILRGTKAADLPVEQPTTFELVINERTAKALGLTVPPSLLARANEVIE
jgi:hypothetical protein